MPIYVYQCFTCNKTEEKYRPISQREDPVECRACGRPMKPVISKPTESVGRPKVSNVFRKV